MSLIAFSRPGRFFRGNLHCHSTNSDGALPPETVVARYRDAGYDFVALTDHFLAAYDWPISDTRAFRDETFTTLIGAEVHTPQTRLGDYWHILAVGLPFDFAPTRTDETGPELAARARAAGAFVAIAHPEWYGLTVEEGRALEAAHAVEVYNHTCWFGNNRTDGWYLCDALLSEGRRLTAIAVDDAHFRNGDLGGGWVNVKTQSPDPGALLAALKDGAFYASQGPEIHDMTLDGEFLNVRCSPAAFVAASGRGPVTERAAGPDVAEARLRVERFRAGGYLRVTVVDDAGRRAWTSPVWLD